MAAILLSSPSLYTILFALWLIVLLSPNKEVLVSCFYLPGVAPRDFQKGQQVELKVNKLTSTRTQIPLDYYSFPFCKPKEGVKHYGENLGEFLTGDRIENSPYQIYMLTNQRCQQLCRTKFTDDEVKLLKEAISEGYSHNWIIDNLPAASVVEYQEGEDVYDIWFFSRGFLVGHAPMDESDRYYINNHVEIELDYHESSSGSFRVVGFRVKPASVHHKFEGCATGVDCWDGKGNPPAMATCNGQLAADYGNQEIVANQDLLFTYDVVWTPSDTHWASRWDIYLNMDSKQTDKVHWFFIANSTLIVLFLSGLIAMILVRNLCRDISRYNRVPTEEERAEDREESGWKLVHADVFRPPSKFPMMLSVMVGTGMQILCMSIITVIFAAIGFLSPSNRGSLMIAVLLLYVLMGSIAGYTSAVLYKMMKGKQYNKCTMLTAFWYPGICFSVFLALDLVDVSYSSTGAVPFAQMLKLLVLWFGISVPLVFIGAYIGYKKETMTFPVVTSNLPRQIPDQPWYLSGPCISMIGGILPFGACFLELFFILTSMWMGAYYYVFGFLLLVLGILALTCAEISIVLCYFQLCNEDYNWWWRSFLCSGSTGVYVFLYSAIYFFRTVQPNLFATYVLYFGYMGIISVGITLFTGSVGFLSSLWFTRLIYGSIKVD